MPMNSIWTGRDVPKTCDRSRNLRCKFTHAAEPPTRQPKISPSMEISGACQYLAELKACA